MLNSTIVATTLKTINENYKRLFNRSTTYTNYT